jgi:hypothetical protein
MNVIIPEKFFFEEAKKEYYNIPARLVAELIQNSYDAGATEIKLDFDSKGYSCIDNGRGMDKKALISSMLTLGGSKKDVGATGGFGAAKKIILFAHKSYQIHSNETKAIGSGLKYKFINCEPINGTSISAEFFDEFPHYYFTNETNSFLRKSKLSNCKVIVNGEEFVDWEDIGEEFESSKFWTAHLSNDKTYWVRVYHNGLFMFERYVGEIKKHVSINVTVPSVEVFSQNRGDFVGDAKTLFDDFCKKIITNPNIGFARNFKTVIYKGNKTFIEKMQDTYDEQTYEEFSLTPQDVENIRNVVRNERHIEDQSQLIAALHNSGFEQVAKKVSELDGKNFKVNYDFYLSFDENEDESKYVNLIKDSKYKFVASLYKTCIKEIMRIDKHETNFYIGFCFDNEAASKRDNKFNVFYINPTKFIGTNNFKEMCCKIIALAMHEYIHIQETNHDDTYACALTDLTEKVLMNVKSYDELIEEAISEQNKNI